jgi:hypothetical protein
MEEAITIRRSTEQDAPLIARLAALDSRPSPGGEAVLAFVRGELRAALPLGRGEAVADPFHPSLELLELLRVRVAQERARGPRQEQRGRLLPRRQLNFGAPREARA